jgi:hypothetical protein
MIQIDKPMPEGCDVCPLMYDYIQCKALPEDCIDDEAFYEDEFDWTKRPEWCPLKEQPKIVQCKDCKYGVKSPTFQYYPEVTWCNKYSTSHNDEWFCADGERKEGR